MHGIGAELPVLLQGNGIEIRRDEWGGMYVALQVLPAGTGAACLLTDLKEARCSSSHWGYVVKGRARIVYTGREEVLQAGDIFYLAAGHTMLVEEDLELVQFTPPVWH